MAEFAYAAPTSVSEAVGLLSGAKGAAKLMSGGTDLLVQLRAGRVRCDLVVDTKKIAGISGIRQENGAFIVGAATSGAELGEHAGLVAAWPGVVEGANLIGSTQVQGRATLAGNLCNASPAADSVPAMVAGGVTCVVVGPNGSREAPVEQIPVSPGRTSLAKDEFILEFRFPARPALSSDAYLRFIPRTEMDIAVVGVGVNLTRDASGVITSARVALGAVAPTVLLVDACAKAIVGTKLDEAALVRLAEAASAACRPIDDKRGTAEFRIKVAGVIARRTAAIAYERAGAR